MEMRPESAKGARLVTYSKDFPRKIVGHAWQWNTERSHLWRRKVEIFAKLHGITEFEGLTKAFGPKWAFWFRDVIESMNLLAFAPVDFDLRCVEMNSVDMERFSQSLTVKGFSLVGSMHHYRPRPPCDSHGSPFAPPRALAAVFAFHCGSWIQAPPPPAAKPCAARASVPSRLSVARGGLTNLLPEVLEERRKRLLAPVHALRFEEWSDEEKDDPWWADIIRKNPHGMPILNKI